MAPTRLERFLRLSSKDRALLTRAFVLVVIAKASLWLLPLQTVRRLLARAGRLGARSGPPERIRWAIDVAQRAVPRATCLPQALAGEALLVNAGREATLRIGVQKAGTSTVVAHAWVECDGEVVIGQLEQGLSHLTHLPPLPPPSA